MRKPDVDRPEMPDGYGVETASRYVSWEDVVERLRESRHYWLATTRADGRPHVVPRWGVWLDDRFWYDGSPDTLHTRNLEGDPRCVLHLESGSEVTIVEGSSLRSDPISGELGQGLSAEFVRKYGPQYTPGPDAWSDDMAGGMRFLKPDKALAWTDFPRDLTRFTFRG